MPIILRGPAENWIPGDVALVLFALAGTDVPAGIPGDVTSVTLGTGTTLGAGNSISARYARRTLVDGDTNLGSWTSGVPGADWTALVIIFRNTHSTFIGKIGTSQTGSGNVVTFPAVTAPLNDTNSWVVGGAVRNNEANTANMDNPPSGMTNIDAHDGNEPKVGFHHTGIVSSWAATNQTYGTNAGAWIGMAMELRAADSNGLYVVDTRITTGTTMPGTPLLPTQAAGTGFGGYW